jgi:solute:Na+ symporter, SSS family
MIFLIIIAAYFVIMLGIGFFTRRFAKTLDGFFVANRKRSTFLITGSLVATIIGGSATVGMAGLGFTKGLSGMWWLLVGSVGLVILGIFFAAKVRNFVLYTVPQILEKQYGGSAAMLSSIVIVIAWIGVIAGQIVAANKILTILDIGSPQIWMLIFTGVIITYSFFGGQFADIGTDMVQAIIKLSGIIVCVILILIQVGGWGGLKSALPPDNFSFPVSAKFTPLDLVSYLFLVGSLYVVGPDIYSKIFCAKDGKIARRATLWTALIIGLFAVGITIIGMGAAALFPNISPEQAFPAMIKDLFPPIVGGLIMAAVVSATMSAAASCLLSSSTILTVDIIKKSRPSLSDKQTLGIARVSVIGLGGLALLLALFLNGIISALLFAYTVYTAGVIVPVLAGFYKNKLKVTQMGAVAAIIGGGGFALASKLIGPNYPSLSLLFKVTDLSSIFVSAGLLFGVSFIERRMKRGQFTLAPTAANDG